MENSILLKNEQWNLKFENFIQYMCILLYISTNPLRFWTWAPTPRAPWCSTPPRSGRASCHDWPSGDSKDTKCGRILFLFYTPRGCSLHRSSVHRVSSGPAWLCPDILDILLLGLASFPLPFFLFFHPLQSVRAFQQFLLNWTFSKWNQCQYTLPLKNICW